MQAMRIGGLAKSELETNIADVVEADLHLELLLPCNMISKRELVPDEFALHPPPSGVAEAEAVLGGPPSPPSPPRQAPGTATPERSAGDLRRTVTVSSTIEG